ncbi:hypothetical protein [Burkholderia plantarii]|uniref:hypothetical protein n=1 Tax=Burkholderia plantarii TaxID=41899 RepID=UPI00114CC27F|nr:hypothetical protein [Burkholderia plantarii]
MTNNLTDDFGSLVLQFSEIKLTILTQNTRTLQYLHDQFDIFQIQCTDFSTELILKISDITKSSEEAFSQQRLSFFDPDDSTIEAHISFQQPISFGLEIPFEHPKCDRLCFRIVRALILRYYHAHGFPFLHASAVTFENKAVLILGSKKAGKTTSALCLSTYGPFSPLANDKLFLSEYQNKIIVRALPMTFGIRAGTLNTFPKIRRLAQEANQLDGESNEGLGDKVARLSINSISNTLKKKVTPNPQLALVLYPQFIPDATQHEFSPIAPIEAISVFNENRLTKFNEICNYQKEAEALWKNRSQNDVAKLSDGAINAFQWKYNPKTLASSIDDILLKIL